jgi:hypothetical protein
MWTTILWLSVALLVGSLIANCGWKRFACGIGIIVAIGLAHYGYRLFREPERLRIVAENTRKAEALKAEIDRRFPLGTLESKIVDFLTREHPDYANWGGLTNADYGVRIGLEPSNVWYCESWTAYVQLRLTGGRLSKTEIIRGSTDCL